MSDDLLLRKMILLLRSRVYHGKLVFKQRELDAVQLAKVEWIGATRRLLAYCGRRSRARLSVARRVSITPDSTCVRTWTEASSFDYFTNQQHYKSTHYELLTLVKSIIRPSSSLALQLSSFSTPIKFELAWPLTRPTASTSEMVNRFNMTDFLEASRTKQIF